MGRNFEAKRQMTEVSELMTTARVDINLTSSCTRRAETYQKRTSVFIVIGSQQRISKDNLDGQTNNFRNPKEETLAQQNNKDMYEQSKDIDERHVFDGEEKFLDDKISSENKLKVTLKECKRFSICDSLDTNDPLQATCVMLH